MLALQKKLDNIIWLKHNIELSNVVILHISRALITHRQPAATDRTFVSMRFLFWVIPGTAAVI